MLNQRVAEVGRDLWKSSGSNSPAQAGTPRAACPGLCPDGFFWIYPIMETPQPVWETSASALSSSVKKCFLMFSEAIASDPVTENHRHEPGSVLFAPSPQVLVDIDKIQASSSITVPFFSHMLIKRNQYIKTSSIHKLSTSKEVSTNYSNL